MESLHVSALQLDLIWEDPEANRAQIAQLLANDPVDTDLIVLPEMFTTGFSMSAKALAETEEGPTVQWMHALAAQKQALVMGSLIIEEEGNYYNRALVVDQEEILVEYNKRHLFSMAEEHLHYTPGQEWVWFEYKGWRITPMICYDLRFPVWSRNRADAEGRLAYDLLIYVANWPSKRVVHWETLLQARAIENQAYVVGVNRVGTDGLGFPYSGSSMIVDYMGKALQHEVDKQAILHQVLDPRPMNDWRTSFPIWQDNDTFELYL